MMNIVYVCEYRVGLEPKYEWKFGALFSTEALAKKRFAEMNEMPETTWEYRNDLVGWSETGYWYGECISANPLLSGYVEAFRILPTIVDIIQGRNND